MKTTLSAQQMSFFTKNGFIEFEIPHGVMLYSVERDVWRKEPGLKDFLVRKLGPIALTLARQPQLLLACDQGVVAENRPAKACSLKEMFSIQGLALGVAMANNPVAPAKKSSLGILPQPTAGHILFFRPDLILDWPHVTADLYLVVFGLKNAVYAHNPKDPSINFLKHLGYHFGDVLRNETHPMIR